MEAYIANIWIESLIYPFGSSISSCVLHMLAHIRPLPKFLAPYGEQNVSWTWRTTSSTCPISVENTTDIRSGPRTYHLNDK